MKMNKMWALPVVDQALCTLCGLCVEACPCHAVKLGEQGPVFACPEVCPSTGSEASNCCCLCEEICPTDAISCAFEIVFETDQDGEAVPIS
jgi:formate hydrogenlyase subunit 6/NADH:ubiquinone oxidoreductase subunit I